MQGKRVTLRQLAKELKLSPTTVSRALNGYPEVNAQTTDRVKEAALLHGYFPDRNAKRLAKGKVGAIGLIVDADSDSFMNPILAEFLDGVGRELARSETDLVIQPIHTKDVISAYKRAVAQQSVDGFVVNSPKEFDERVQFLAGTQMPFVLHGRTKGAQDHSFYDIDNEGGFYKATQNLVSFGHRRIGFLGGDAEQTFTLDRLRGTRRALDEAGLTLREDDVHLGPMTEQTGYLVGQRYFETKNAARPTAFLCLSLFVALGLIRAARERNFQVPQDFSVIVHDDRAPYLKAEYFDPPLTAIQSSIRTAGAQVAKLVAARIENRHDACSQIIEPVDFHQRGSVAAANTLG